MTVSDYINTAQDSVTAFLSNLLPNLSDIIASIFIVAIGIIVGWILKRVVDEISKAVNLERALSGLVFYQRVVKSHESQDLTTFLGELVRWTAIFVFLVPAIGILGIAGADGVFSQFFAFVRDVLLASFFLLVGFVVAWFVHRVIMTVGVTVGTNPSHLIANLAYISIVIFAALGAIAIIGVPTDLVRLFIIAAFAAFALAFGLAGKDTGMGWLKKFTDSAK